MTQETEVAAPADLDPEETAIGICATCDALFLIHGGRQTSPCHGVEPGDVINFNAITETVNLLVSMVEPLSRALTPEVIAVLERLAVLEKQQAAVAEASTAAAAPPEQDPDTVEATGPADSLPATGAPRPESSHFGEGAGAEGKPPAEEGDPGSADDGAPSNQDAASDELGGHGAIRDE